MNDLNHRILNCTRCKRLRCFMDKVKNEHPDYHCDPVLAFGDQNARLFILGLAPGMHGANATGRPFTGDYAGDLLYKTLHQFGFSNQTQATHQNDGLQLFNCRISNAVKCLPPQNKPNGQEVQQCQDFLREELKQLPANAIVLALGKIAHDALLRTLNLRLISYPFAHAAEHDLNNGLKLIDSYHCSRYNTQTKRLTPEMFSAVFALIQQHLSHA